MYISFAIHAWAAIAPGISSSIAWQSWALDPWLPEGEADPDLQAVAPMDRRRLSRLGKMAVSVAMSASDGVDSSQLPVVWASRYGDARRSIDLLGQHAQEEPLSPTAFALSVHNGIGAQYSITQKVSQNASSLAAGTSTPEAGVIEAVSLLSEGHREVLLVCYDVLLPGAYARFHDGPAAEFAWAARISTHDNAQNATRFALHASESAIETQQSTLLPPGLDVFRFFLSGHTTLQRARRIGHWHWSRL